MSTANIEEATTSAPLRPKEQDEELQRVIEEFAHLGTVDNFNRVAAKVVPISATSQQLVCELVIEPEHVNTKGTLHGGFSASLVDIITARAIGVTVKDKGMASVEIAVSYLLPVKLGERIRITATVLKIGRSLAFTDIEFRREDGKVTVLQAKEWYLVHGRFQIAVKGKHTVAILPNDPPVTATGRVIQY